MPWLMIGGNRNSYQYGIAFFAMLPRQAKSGSREPRALAAPVAFGQREFQPFDFSIEGTGVNAQFSSCKRSISCMFLQSRLDHFPLGAWQVQGCSMGWGRGEGRVATKVGGKVFRPDESLVT